MIRIDVDNVIKREIGDINLFNEFLLYLLNLLLIDERYIGDKKTVISNKRKSKTLFIDSTRGTLLILK